jgi:NADPH-dependent 2,4-dienoyl-CoA reductase/sulfur reductase-like enzyme
LRKIEIVDLQSPTWRGADVMDVTLVEMADHILPTMLDKNMAKIVERELEANGTLLLTGYAD